MPVVPFHVFLLAKSDAKSDEFVHDKRTWMTIGRTDSGSNFLEHRQRPAASACFSARDGALNG